MLTYPGANGMEESSALVFRGICSIIQWYSADGKEVVHCSRGTATCRSNLLPSNPTSTAATPPAPPAPLQLCEQMWDGAFIYEPEEDTAYTMSWEPGTPNPNNQVNLHVAFPDPCPGQDFPDADEVCGEEALRHPDIIPHACELCTVGPERTLGHGGGGGAVIWSVIWRAAVGDCLHRVASIWLPTGHPGAGDALARAGECKIVPWLVWLVG